MKMKIEKNAYIPVIFKFWICQAFAFLWFLFSVYLSWPWIKDLANIIGMVPSILVIAGIAYIPGYMNAFMVLSLLLDKQPKLKIHNSTEPISVLISCKNEEKGIRDTLKYLSFQDYEGEIKVIVIDNASTDKTGFEALKAGQDYSLNVKVIYEEKPGKNFALNRALKIVDTPFVITLDADTLLTKSAVRLLVCRLLSAPKGICAVAGAVLVRNSRKTFGQKFKNGTIF